ncbi:FixH family protein [Microvirga sp. W0021]|uniref:FixH family protein n=1 Tax=Hohaiivirga grylli TaxID=3133970 RepID=A0ABV0BQ61_9HYPH
MMSAPENTGGFKLNGWHVLTIFVGAFAIVGAVNAYMVYTATTTLRGLDVKNAYERGVAYQQDVVAAREQTERQWNVDIIMGESAGTKHNVTVTARTKDDAALTGLNAVLYLTHPSDAGKDAPVKMTEVSPGTFTGQFEAESGNWYLQLTLNQNGEVKFRSRNSIKLQ